MPNQMEQLSQFTKIVADTGEIEQIKQFQPQDATTNPSLLLAAVKNEDYKSVVDDAIEYGKSKGGSESEVVTNIMDRLAVNFGSKITEIVPGVVSTEVDARLSFDTKGSIEKAHKLIEMYKELGIDKDRVLIKLATTWEGLQAAKQLESEGIHCNMTLLFSIAQAVVAAKYGCTLISPFVGRITDWYKAHDNVSEYKAEEDPGVKSVRSIFKYYKKFGHKTIVMGASFRNKGQVLALAGCDKLTISPKLLGELKDSDDQVERQLHDEVKEDIEELDFDESSFRFAINDDQMATEKLAEGIRKFAADAITLENIIRERLNA